ncbi:MAG: hypothetical protein ABH860_00795 [bacterium]
MAVYISGGSHLRPFSLGIGRFMRNNGEFVINTRTGAIGHNMAYCGSMGAASGFNGPEFKPPVGNCISFKSLFAKEKIKQFFLRSSDPELGFQKEISPRHDEKPFIPEPLRSLPEQEEMWAFVRNFSTDVQQIRQRQAVIDKFLSCSFLDELQKAKNASYLINAGIKKLFALVSVNEYSNAMLPALEAYRQGNKELEGYIMDCLAKIEKGKKSLAQLIELLHQMNTPLMQSIIDDLQKNLESIAHFNDNYFLEQAYDREEAEALNQKTLKNIVNLGMLISFAVLVAKDGYTKASFDLSGPFGYKNGWLFTRKKEGQTLNNSAADKTITILSGSNMSGKSYNLKQNTIIQLLAQSFGYVPCQDGNFDIYDSIIYLDRASTEHSNDLSAFGREVKDWNEAFACSGKKPLLFIDEGFSTTSPEDQYRLLTAVSQYLRDRGAKMYLASHSEKFIEGRTADAGMGIYHLLTDVNDKGDVVYKYVLTSGPDDSKALPVAANLGFPPETIKYAENFLKGIHEKVKEAVMHNWKAITKYPEKKRSSLKKSKMSASDLFVEKKDDHLLHLFSEDSDFKVHWFSGSNIYTGEEDAGNITFGGWGKRPADHRRALILGLITRNGRLTSEEILERQQMFAQLAKNDRYEDVRQICDQLTWTLKFLPMHRRIVDELLTFNVELNPFTERSPQNTIQDIDLVLAYLKLNKKVLKEDFAFDATINKVGVYRSILIKLSNIDSQQDIFDIQAIENKEANEELAPEEANIFLKIATNEPRSKKWNGKVTRRRIRQYYDWLNNKDSSRFSAVRDKLWPLTADYGDFDFSAQAIKDEFLGLVTDEPDSKKWGDLICRQRIADYIEHLERSRHYGSAIEKLDHLLHIIARAQAELDIKDEEIKQLFISINPEIDAKEIFARLTADDIKSSLGAFMERVREQFEHLPNKPVFEVNLTDIAGELKALIKNYKKTYKKGDFEYYSRWPKKLLLALVLEMSVDDRPYFSELIDLLRGYDSVHLHKIANNLEKLRSGLFSVYRSSYDWYLAGEHKKPQIVQIKEDTKYARDFWKDKKEQLERLCPPQQSDKIEADLKQGKSASLLSLLKKYEFKESPDLLRILGAVYDSHFKAIWEEYYKIEKAYKNISIKYPCFKNHYSLEYIRFIKANLNEERNEKIMRELARNLENYTHERYEHFWETLGGAKTMPEKVRIFREFCQKEIIETGLLNEIENILNKTDRMVKEGRSFMEKFGIKFAEKDDSKYFKQGNLYYLSKAVNRTFEEKVYGLFEDISNANKDLDNEILHISALGLFGHMVREDGFARVDFNSTGQLGITGLWNMVEPKNKQVSNPATFGKDEFTKLVTGTNMSGKTYYLKSLVFAISCALATGHAPASLATMPIFDAVAYLDRVNAKNDRNLSAFGNEIQFWKGFLGLLQNNASVFAAVDEAFSTTSPKYQSALTFAMAIELLKKGQYMALASHNHDALNVLQEVQADLIKSYHFKTHFDENGELHFDYQMADGHDLSHAIDVAKKLGLPKEIIDLAERIK